MVMASVHAKGATTHVSLKQPAKIAKKKKAKIPPKESQKDETKMAKWTTHSKGWVLTHVDPRQATMAGEVFRKVAKEDAKYRLDPGMPVRVVGNKCFLSWPTPVTGKTVAGWWYGSEEIMKIIGKGKKAQPMWWGPVGHISHLLAPHPATGTPNSTTGTPLAASGGYPELPPKYGAASLEPPDWWGTLEDPAKPLRILEEFGFLILRGFLPAIVAAPARQSVEAHLKMVMGSLTDGFATEDFDKLASLHPKVWEHKITNPEEGPQVVTHSFPLTPPQAISIDWYLPGILGCALDARGFVTAVKPKGPADQQGVKMGWQVLAISQEIQQPKNLVGGSRSLTLTHTMTGQRSWKQAPLQKERGALGTLSAASAPKASSKHLAKPRAKAIGKGTGLTELVKIKFKKMDAFSPLAITQKWSVSQNQGWQ